MNESDLRSYALELAVQTAQGNMERGMTPAYMGSLILKLADTYYEYLKKHSDQD